MKAIDILNKLAAGIKITVMKQGKLDGILAATFDKENQLIITFTTQHGKKKIVGQYCALINDRPDALCLMSTDDMAMSKLIQMGVPVFTNKKPCWFEIPVTDCIQ